MEFLTVFLFQLLFPATLGPRLESKNLFSGCDPGKLVFLARAPFQLRPSIALVSSIDWDSQGWTILEASRRQVRSEQTFVCPRFPPLRWRDGCFWPVTLVHLGAECILVQADFWWATGDVVDGEDVEAD